jgi:signal transduction histidine kinase
VTVDFDWDTSVLTVTISNSFTGSISDRGHGLDGMRERAILAGGTLTASPSGDRFVVTATLPVVAQ